MSKTTRKQATTNTVARHTTSKPATKKSKVLRPESKQARLIEMLKRPEGATIEEIVKALAWQSHTIRGALSGALKKKLGLQVESAKFDDRGRVYRIAG
jgi:predicted ArsR family transcriptional regulator